MLAALRMNAPARSPLAPETVLVPNRGTARWLQAELAESEGSAANLELPVTGLFVWQVLRDTVGGDQDSSDYERERLAWHLYALLPDIDVPEVRRYLAAEPRERHRYQLAQELADVFDAYLIHRRDVIAAWEAGEEERFPPAGWQAPVWRALVARIGVRHRAQLMTDFLARAGSGDLDASRLPNPLYAFALADLPVDYLRLLYALGRYVDVHFLLPNPSTAYWGDVERRPVTAVDLADGKDVEPEHPLLASLGRAGRDFLRVLYADEFADIDEPDLGDTFPATPPGADTLLHRVQSDLVAGTVERRDSGIDAGDVSIQVHACHGPLREMQVLHDRLLDLLARDPELEPRGILVLLPDVAGYAPAVHSVFGAAGDARWIPYRVSDRPRLDTHPIARTFAQMIELPLSRWTASEVLALAGVPAVMRRFELDEGDLELLHHWAAAAGVRWGLDRDTRAAAGSAAFEQNTWRFGLDRLLLGLAQRDEETLVDGVAPWSDLEGGSGSAIGRLWLLLDRLRHWRDALAEAADAATWQERLNAMAADLFAVDRDEAEEADALETVHEAVATLAGASASLHADTLTWEAVREALLGALAGPSQRQPLITGGVTFAGMEPLRGVPFDVICLVGMDDGAFPRQDGRREFNLLQKHPRTGDPGVRDADRMTFLQALAAARRYFYVSYTGRDVSDGAELQPSPVVGELLDFLHGHYFAGRSREAFRAALVTREPMHPFSPRYFAPDDDALFTFVDDWRTAAEAQQGERHAAEAFVDGTELPAPDTAEPIELGALQDFFRHPARWFFRECLRLELAEEDAALDDEEPRALDPLGMHLLRQRLFERLKDTDVGAVPPEPTVLDRARGELPPAPLGGAEYADAATDANAILRLHRQWRIGADDDEDVDIDLPLDDRTRLLGRVPAVGSDEMRRLRPGGLRLVHVLPWWLAYLAVVAGGRPVGLRLAGTSDGEVMQLAGRIDAETARGYLRTAIDHYREGQRRALLFEPYLAEHYLDRREQSPKGTDRPKTPDEALDDTNGWLSNRYQPPHPTRDPWLQPLFEASPTPLGEDAAKSTFAILAESVARPIRAHLAEPEGDDA